MDEKFLEYYKEIYLQEKISDSALQKSWDDLSRILPQQDFPVRNLFYRYKFLFAGIILLLLIGTAGIVQASRSGELLYPVKILTNNVAAKFFGKPHINAKKQEKNMLVKPTILPKPTEKETGEDQKDLKQERNEIKGQNEREANKSKEDIKKQENEVKGVSSEVTEIKKPENEDRGGINNKNKPNESDNENPNGNKNK